MNSALPASFRKLVVKTLTPIFKNAVEIVNHKLLPPRSNEVLVKNKFVGINASDVNCASGMYYFTANQKPPYDIGFEGIGEIVALGDKVSELKHGQPVMYLKIGSFAEYTYLSEDQVIPVASTNAQLLPLLLSGATASISLDKSGLILPGDKVLITAAAGGTGHIAVQYAKHAGCHVIGTCSSQDKVKYLESIGCDRPINYNEESLENVLKEEYPDGVNVIWETVGGSNFELLFKHLALKGRMVIVGSITDYEKGNKIPLITENITTKLLFRSAMLNGFFVMHFEKDIPHYLSILVRLLHEQHLKPHVDDGSRDGKSFKGLEDITRAVEYLYSRKSIGKVIVEL